MRRGRRFIYIVLLLLFTGSKSFSQRVLISLAGNWTVRLDSMDEGIKKQWYHEFSGRTVRLPGTLDDAGIGSVPQFDTTQMNKPVMIGLARKHRYVGAAWYSREIIVPSAFAGKQVMLYLERVIWKTDLWIDGRKIGSNTSLVAGQEFIVGDLKPGKHRITLCIDNRQQFEVSYKELAHAYTDGTQIIWNGVIGRMELIGAHPTHITDLQVYQGNTAGNITVRTAISNSNNQSVFRLQAVIRDQLGKTMASTEESYQPLRGNDTSTISLQVKNMQVWNEFNPKLYTIEVKLKDASRNNILDQQHRRFGWRKLERDSAKLKLNGQPLFLRGTLECAIFPLTGHPPMDKAGWIRIFTTARQYGLNHLRFHSWCPPEAAFDVADSLGIYLQIELPLWILDLGKDKPTLNFLVSEAEQVLRNYGNHPSFCMFSIGNELQGDFEWLRQLVTTLKTRDPRRLYTTTSFTFEKGHGKWPEKEDDFFVTQWTKFGWVRGQGVFNAHKPDFYTDYSNSVKGAPVPFITHEMGQYSIYPSMKEIDKYTGVLEPLNFKTIRNDLRKKGMLSLADSFKMASGKHAINLYKEEIERILKTDGISGFQLLDLHDFPGQGTALVGLLNAFWDSKDLIDPAHFRQFCGPVVPLLRFEKASYTSAEVFTASAEIANFGDRSINKIVNWTIQDASGKILQKASFDNRVIPIGNRIELGQFSFSLHSIIKATQLTVSIAINGTPYKNEWKIWVYPETLSADPATVGFTTNITEALSWLKEGRSVVLSPDTAQVKGVPGRYTTVFWSPVHFPDQPGSMGLLCDPSHPAFSDFPTDRYSNWQWWDLVMNSKSIVLDDTDIAVKPILRIIDNFYKNRKMATILEFRLGTGKLILSSMDIHSSLDSRPAARQLRFSLLRYAASNKFSPQNALTESAFMNLFKQ